MKTVRTPKGSTNPVIQLTSLVDPSGVNSSNGCVDRCPRACAPRPRGTTVGQPLQGLGVAPNTAPYLRHTALSRYYFFWCS